jgi:uncharacterized damage-inducible protein DinB
MSAAEGKEDLQRYLQRAREAVVWKLDGLSDYNVRRPVTPTGTNLLGLVKHLASVEIGYLGDSFARPFPEQLTWMTDDADHSADMWATPEESREWIVGLYRRVWAHSDATIAGADLDAPAVVPWWPPERRETTLNRILVHLLAETNRHAGHADIVRETIDGAAGHTAGNPNMAPHDERWWQAYREQLEAAARAAPEG